jgi:hypothetical protein
MAAHGVAVENAAANFASFRAKRLLFTALNAARSLAFNCLESVGIRDAACFGGQIKGRGEIIRATKPRSGADYRAAKA